MADRNYLRDRGLADDQSTPAPPPFLVDLDTGQILPGEPDPQVSPGLPDDYAARVLAVTHAARYLIEEATIDQAIDAIHRLHAFLTDTEKTAPKQTTFIDQ